MCYLDHVKQPLIYEQISFKAKVTMNLLECFGNPDVKFQ